VGITFASFNISISFQKDNAGVQAPAGLTCRSAECPADGS
jgi:hypothetical protein